MLYWELSDQLWSSPKCVHEFPKDLKFVRFQNHPLGFPAGIIPNSPSACFLSPSCGILLQRINYCHLIFSLTHYFQMVLLLIFFPQLHTEVLWPSLKWSWQQQVNSHPFMQSKTLKTEKPYWFLSTSPLCLLKGCSFFLYVLYSSISQFSSDLKCSKPLISVSSLFCFYTNRFPHKVLPAIWTDYSFDYSSHNLVPLSSQKWVTIITLIVQMGWGRKRHLATRDRSRYHSSCLPAAIFRHSSATSQNQPHYCSGKVPCMTHSLLTVGSCLTFPCSCVLPPASPPWPIPHATVSHTTCVQGSSLFCVSPCGR